MSGGPVLVRSYDHCERLARSAAKNFYYGFLLLPPRRRRAMCALYAFMRQTDDLADEPGEVDVKRGALEAWRAGLTDALAHPPESARDRFATLPALVDTVRRYEIPPRHLYEVIDGVAMDLEPRVLPTFGDLRRYCYHVASAVGLCCIHIWGYRSDDGRAERLAEACGIALQLTNILRDLREDAAAGRVYLPIEDLEQFGVSAEELREGPMTARMRAMLAFEAERARAFYREAEPLVRLVAPVGRPVLRAMVGIYRSLLDEITRRDYDVLSGRVALPRWRKGVIMARSLVGGL